ncbi:MAG: hypothetical protein EOP87_20925 [Verrucomicrobiaceae bacterium]|nr:MAG: hypothetical protein EOP87_20925 [Verrucomicrobiaceae bacterium]
MKTHSLIYSIVAILFAVIFFISFFSVTFVILPNTPVENRGISHLVIVLYLAAVPLLVTGAVTNLVKGRPVVWATSLIMAGYLLLIWLLPLTIWGGVMLYLNRGKTNAPA